MSRANTTRDAELAFLALLLRWADIQPSSGLPLDQEDVRSLYQAVTNYYKASNAELDQVRRSDSPIDEVPVFLHIARSGGVDIKRLLELRLTGEAWTQILGEYHITREAFYVPVGSPTAVFPGMSYRHLLEDAREAWSDPDLCEPDIVNLVNLKFISEYYGCRAEQVIALRSSGWPFARIHGALGGRTPSSRPRRPAH